MINQSYMHKKRVSERLPTHHLKRISSKNRNRIRAILNVSEADGYKVFNILREQSSARELYHAEAALRELEFVSYKLPELFPPKAQVKEDHYRLCDIENKKQLALLEMHAEANILRLKSLIYELSKFNRLAFDAKYGECDEALAYMLKQFGYSHLLLRKACWVKSEAPEGIELKAIESLLIESGIGDKNLITTSIVNCFSIGQDYLALRRSMLSITPRGIGGARNKFTRDMARQIFLPKASDEKDFTALIQSSLQSSLFDAIICYKINRDHIVNKGHRCLDELCRDLDTLSIDIDSLAARYIDQEDSEVTFFQRSGAWIELDDVISYRLISDFFYDPAIGSLLPDGSHILARCHELCSIGSISDITLNAKLTNHNLSNLKKLQDEGLVTRSAVFNYVLYKTNGHDRISEQHLLWIMSNTRDLSRTINTKDAKFLVQGLPTRLSKIIIYLLIVKRTRDDLSSKRLHSLLEKEIIENHNSDFMAFIEHLGKNYQSVAIYLHEICTEDFLANLTQVIRETKAITDTRAMLHEWRGRVTNETTFLDRAKAIRIDYKIGLVRGEIDDNRIYVDPARFLEWLEDNVVGELTTVLTSVSHNLTADEKIDDPQLNDLISRCFFEFTSNRHYGIASYIGRRIRHGTFKGHVFTNVVSIEKDYKSFLGDPVISDRYAVWRNRFEDYVTLAVTDKLHIESQTTKDGLIRPHTRNSIKQDVVSGCMGDLVKTYRNSGTTNGLPPIILDYCWRIVEIDLLGIRRYLNEMRSSLGTNELISDLKRLWTGHPQTCSEFTQELYRSLTRQFGMAQNWFKRPPSVSPKASVNLLYKAVIREVQETFKDFSTDDSYDEDFDLEIYGELYHRIYDALFVVIYNAAKHGKPSKSLARYFSVEKDRDGRSYLILDISSEIKDTDDADEVNRMLQAATVDVLDAQVRENRSGIPKLRNLSESDENFKVEFLRCVSGRVTVALSYRMAY